MSQETEIKPTEINELTITEQLIFILELIRDKENPTILEAKKNYAVMGAAIADAFNLKKAGLINNKIVILDSKKTEYDYINDLTDTLHSLRNNKLLIDVIFGYQHKGRDFEIQLLEELGKKGLIYEKRKFLPLIGPKEIHVNESDRINQIKDQVEKTLSINSQPEEKIIYIMAILDAIDLFPYVLDSTVEIEGKKKQLHELMEKEPLTKSIHKAIKNEPNPESLAMYEEYPMYTNGGML